MITIHCVDHFENFGEEQLHVTAMIQFILYGIDNVLKEIEAKQPDSLLPVNAVIEGNTIIPGKNGKEVKGKVCRRSEHFPFRAVLPGADAKGH